MEQPKITAAIRHNVRIAIFVLSRLTPDRRTRDDIPVYVQYIFMPYKQNATTSDYAFQVILILNLFRKLFLCLIAIKFAKLNKY